MAISGATVADGVTTAGDRDRVGVGVRRAVGEGAAAARMRWLAESATNTAPLGAMAMPLGVLNCMMADEEMPGPSA